MPPAPMRTGCRNPPAIARRIGSTGRRRARGKSPHKGNVGRDIQHDLVGAVGAARFRPVLDARRKSRPEQQPRHGQDINQVDQLQPIAALEIGVRTGPCRAADFGKIFSGRLVGVEGWRGVHDCQAAHLDAGGRGGVRRQLRQAGRVRLSPRGQCQGDKKQRSAENA